jgi:hypothetical protein
MNDDTNRSKEPDDSSTKDDMQAELGWVDLGSEPYWMQDIRLAERKLQAERQRLRAASQPGARPEKEA